MRRLALLLLFTLIVACSRSCSRVAIGTGSDAAPHTPRMGGLVSPPPFPSLPGGAVLDLRIDLGRTNTSGILTQWVDQSPNAYVFTPPGVQTGPVIAATQFQQYDGQSWQNLTTIELSSTAAQPWTSGQARTIAAVTGAVNAANSPVMRMGGSGSTPIIYEGGTVSIGGTANNTGPLLYEGSPHIKTWAFTPATNQAVYLNGYQVTALTAGTAIGGTVTSDSGNANLQLGHDDAAGTLKFPGDIEQVEGYAGILSAPTLTSLHGYLAGKFEITGVQGYVSDSATIPFYAFYQYMNMIASEGALRFYTTQTSGNISFTAQQSTSQAPTTTNLPMYEVFIDGV